MPDLCLVVAPQNKETILDRIAKEVAKSWSDPVFYYYETPDLPRAERYMVMHYSLLPGIMQQVNPDITPVSAFYTHNKGNLDRFVDLFNLCSSVIAESPSGMEELRNLGVKNPLLHFVPECADPGQFPPHPRKEDGGVLICGTNYPDGRKNPQLVHAVTKLMPHRKFYFIGKGWGGDEAEYSEYPRLYKECSVYLSCSHLEGGGPNSLIEAMHSNLVPVVSDTGNAREYIVHGYNGYIFSGEDQAEDVTKLIDLAYLLHPENSIPYNDIWQTVRSFTWANYSLQMKEAITGNMDITNSQELLDEDITVQP